MNTCSQSLETTAQRLKQHAWLPPDLLRLALEVTRLQEATQPAAPLVPDTLASPEAHSQGLPLLMPEFWPYDARAAATLWDALLALVLEMPDPMGRAARAVRASMDQHQEGLAVAEAFTALVGGDSAYFARWEAQLPEAPAMPRFLATAALTPWLAAFSAALEAHHNKEQVWEYGHCPHCGHPPLMGQLRGREGFRWHVCSFCRLEYRAPRLQCPICQEKDHQKLHFFTTASEAGYEVHVCESCKNYIKLRDLREMESSATCPALDDLDSLPLDLAARQQGYVRSTLSAWGF